MGIHKHYPLSLITFLLFAFVITSCKTQQNEYGSDADYFVGLRMLYEGNEKDARIKFNACIKKGSYECAKKSAQILTTFGEIDQQNEACENLMELYPDADSELLVAEHYNSIKDYDKVIDLTYGINLAEDDNQLISLRLNALQIKKDNRYKNELYQWFTSRSISQEHYQFYRDVYLLPALLQAPAISAEDLALNFRINVYKRNFTENMENAPVLLQYFEDKTLEPKAQLISDLGKTYLSGSTEFDTNAELFTSLAEKYKGTEAEFYFWFYAGRYFDKNPLYFTQSNKCYTNAIECTPDPKKQDNALWYLLKNISSTSSIEEPLQSFGEYSKSWHDPSYFDDLFDSIIPQIMASGKWNHITELMQNVEGHITDETAAQLNYIYGRLIQESLISVDEPASESKKYFEKALYSGSAPYYKMLAAYQLGLNNEEALKIILSPSSKKEVDINKDAETLLKGYARFSFPEKIYSEWQNYGTDKISTETTLYLSEFLRKCADDENNYFMQSLRMAAKAVVNSTEDISKETMTLAYPKPFSELIENACLKYNLEPSVMYALIRSESFFNAEISSSAGAVGLCQLMDFTAADVARKLRIKDYSITDPETNIEFGTFYLAELIGRLDGSKTQAFFSYNAGITKVRRWLQNYIPDYNERTYMPADLFLESADISETREYGRKLISATVYYEMLYETEKSYAEIIEEILN